MKFNNKSRVLSKIPPANRDSTTSIPTITA